MRDEFLARLLSLAKEDGRIMLLTGDLGFKVLDAFKATLPRQFLNVGVAEQNMTGLATGLALEGRIVFTYSIANFVSLRCLEQLRNDVCYHDADVKAVCIGAGFSYGAVGMSHHATEDLAILRSFPNMTICSPGNTWEVEEATTALVNTPGPAYFRLDRMSASVPVCPGEVFTLGRARILREGSDFTLISTGGILEEALKAADDLVGQGICCRVISLHTLRPLDIDTIAAAARETGGIATIEEHTVSGGLGGLVAEELMEFGALPRVFYRFGLREGFSSIIGSQEYLRKRYGLDAESIAAKVRELVMNEKKLKLVV